MSAITAPCPRCQATALEVRHETRNGSNATMYIECTSCGSRGTAVTYVLPPR